MHVPHAKIMPRAVNFILPLSLKKMDDGKAGE